MNFGLFNNARVGSKLRQDSKRNRGARNLKKRILVLEDDLEITEIFKTMKEERGWNIEFASNSREALDLVSKGPYDLLIVDWNLPDFNAGDFIKLSDAHYTRHTEKNNYAIYHKVPVITFSSEIPTKISIEGSKYFFHQERWRKPMGYKSIENHVLEAISNNMIESVL